MNELHEILQAWRKQLHAERSAVLATVVHVQGSAYRQPGARMLILPDGKSVGGVSGGCLEGELIRKAWWFTESETPVVKIYDTTSDDDAVWEFGLGCNGVVHVLLERANGPAGLQLQEYLDERFRTRSSAVVATIIRGQSLGSRLCVDAVNPPAGDLAGAPLGARIQHFAEKALQARESQLVHLGDVDVFVEYVAPPVHLVVFGAGHDAIPLVRIAAGMGWDVTVVDGRPAYACKERFPEARRVFVLRRGEGLDAVPIGEDAAVVVMTHNFPLDLHLVPQILALRPRYVGLLGPRSRAEKLFQQIGQRIPADVHAPVGLDIGGDAPAAIALSIAADIQAALSGRCGGSLMRRHGPIHLPAAETGVSVNAAPPECSRPDYCDITVAEYA